MEFEYYQDKEGNAYELKTNLEKLLVHEIFEQDKEIERLKKREQECTNHYLVQCKYASEMEEKYITANNIINELEKWLEQEYAVVKANSIQEPNNPEWYIKWNERKNTLDKLQELKGSDKDA